MLLTTVQKGKEKNLKRKNRKGSNKLALVLLNIMLCYASHYDTKRKRKKIQKEKKGIK